MNTMSSYHDYHDYHYDDPHDYYNDINDSYSFSSYFFIYDFGIHDHEAFPVIYTVSFVILLFLVVFGLLTNAIQLYGIVAFPWVRQRVDSVFIAHMTVTGLGYLSVAGTISLYVCGYWAFPSDHYFSMAHMIGILIYEVTHAAFLFNMAASITALAFDQYLSVVRPMVARRWRTQKNALRACAIIFAGSVVIIVLEGSLTPHTISWYQQIELAQELLYFVFLCLIPIILTVAFSISTSRALQSARAPSEPKPQHAVISRNFTQLQEDDGELSELDRSAQQMPSTIALTISFVVCWFTSSIINLLIIFIIVLRGFHHPIYKNNKAEVLVMLAAMAEHFNIAFNPVLYWLFNKQFRRHLLSVVFRRIPRENQVPLSEHVNT